MYTAPGHVLSLSPDAVNDKPNAGNVQLLVYSTLGDTGCAAANF